MTIGVADFVGFELNLNEYISPKMKHIRIACERIIHEYTQTTWLSVCTLTLIRNNVLVSVKVLDKISLNKCIYS